MKIHPMNTAWFLSLGVLASVIASLLGLSLIPNAQLWSLEPVELEDGQQYPLDPSARIEAGRNVYISLGCLYCHSQQVRPDNYGSDLARGWGNRRSVPLDYLYDDPHLTGTMRTGPDLFNIGERQPSDTWHHLHLYDPETYSPGSTMPPFPFLYETYREEELTPALRAQAYELPEGFGDEERFIVPKADAINLVEYLKSLQHSMDLPPEVGPVE